MPSAVSPLVAAGAGGSLQGTMLDPNLVQQQAYEQLVAGLASAQQEAEANYNTRRGEANATMDQYVQAAQQPTYSPLAGAAVLPLAAANFADQLTGGNAAAKTAQGEIELQRADMLRRRQATLQKLMVQYEDQAKAAERTGQFAEALKQNQKVLSLTKAYEQTIDVLDKMAARGAEQDRRLHDERMQGERLKHEDWRTRYTQDQENVRAKVKELTTNSPAAKAEIEASLKEYQAAVTPMSEQLTFLLGAPDNEATRKKREQIRQGMAGALATFQGRVADIEGRYTLPGEGAPRVQPPPTEAPKVTAKDILDHLSKTEGVTSLVGFERWAKNDQAQSLTVGGLNALRAEAEIRFARQPRKFGYVAPAGEKDTGR